MMTDLRRGFTLLEVNLAIFIMSTGVLVMCGLYGFGFAENRQSVEDVVASSYADAFFSPIVAALSATNVSWDAWTKIGVTASGSTGKAGDADSVAPKDGWNAYIDDSRCQTKCSQCGDQDGLLYRIRDWKSPSSQALAAINSRVKVTGKMPTLPKDYCQAFVVTRSGSTIQLALKVSRRKEMLLAQPTFVTEVRYQGDPDSTGGSSK